MSQMEEEVWSNARSGVEARRQFVELKGLKPRMNRIDRKYGSSRRSDGDTTT